MIILLSTNVLYSAILSRSKRAISVVIMFWENGGHEGYAFHEQRTLSRRWKSSEIPQLFYFLCLGKEGPDTL